MEMYVPKDEFIGRMLKRIRRTTLSVFYVNLTWAMFILANAGLKLVDNRWVLLTITVAIFCLSVMLYFKEFYTTDYKFYVFSGIVSEEEYCKYEDQLNEDLYYRIITRHFPTTIVVYMAITLGIGLSISII